MLTNLLLSALMALAAPAPGVQGNLLLDHGKRSVSGMPVFPGAVPRADRRHDQSGEARKAALRLTNIEARDVFAEVFVADASPDKVLDFYRRQLGQIGALTECRGGDNPSVHVEVGEVDINEPTHCDPTKFGANETELKAVAGSERYIISVERKPAGSEFAVVHVRLH